VRACAPMPKTSSTPAVSTGPKQKLPSKQRVRRSRGDRSGARATSGGSLLESAMTEVVVAAAVGGGGSGVGAGGGASRAAADGGWGAAVGGDADAAVDDPGATSGTGCATAIGTSASPLTATSERASAATDERRACARLRCPTVLQRSTRDRSTRLLLRAFESTHPRLASAGYHRFLACSALRSRSAERAGHPGRTDRRKEQ
jgi:hypothetical protein